MACSCTEPENVPEKIDENKKVDMTVEAMFDINAVMVPQGVSDDHAWGADASLSILTTKTNDRFEMGAKSDDDIIASFTGQAPKAEEYFAVYPYAADLALTDGKLNALLPTTQTAVKDGYDMTAGISAARSSEKFFELRNIGALIGFTVADEGIKSVTLTTDGSAVSGEFELSLLKDGTMVSKVITASNTITLSGDFENDGKYWFVVLPGTFHNASLQFRKEKATATYSIKEAMAVKRSSKTDLGTVVIPESSWSDYIPDEPDPTDPDEPDVTEDGVLATPADEFLSSIGVNTAIVGRGEWLEKTIECMRYLGARWIRSGDAGDESGLPRFQALHNQLGTKFSIAVNCDNISTTISLAKKLVEMDAFIAFEGPNEPNNWAITYNGVKGGGGGSWKAVGQLMTDLCAAKDADAVLKDYPVWSTTETGAETDNVGLQFLTIPPGQNCVFPAGTKFADVACCHNYFIHSKWGGPHDNQTWNAADPIEGKYCDGLYDNFGKTWAKKYAGYSNAEREKLPRVTTETGVTLDGTFKNWDGSYGTQSIGITEDLQGKLYLACYLSQFKRDWRYTAIYIMRDRGDELSNQTFGFYGCGDWDYSHGGWAYTKRLAADYLHNMTTILADPTSIAKPGRLDYKIPSQPSTVHDLLLQKNDGSFWLVLWDERFEPGGGSDYVNVEFGKEWETINVYNPINGVGTEQTFNNVSKVQLFMTDHPLILNFR